MTLALATGPAFGADLGQDGFADSGGVKIHYVTAGQGPLVVMIHGFPDFWYSWRDQMPALAKHFQVVAIDQRGYNKSDQPKGVDNYTVAKLVGDLEAVLKHFKKDKAILVGHDWGGLVAWSFAMAHPEKTDRLIILNLPHPKGLMRELAHNPEQQKNSQYARNFQKPGVSVPPEMLAMWVQEPDARKRYVEALKRSSMEGMLNYYKANYPREPYKDDVTFPPVKCSVLMIHGLKDIYLLPGALNDNWKYVEKDFTLVTVPQAGHFVHRDAPEFVTRTMVNWLLRDVGTKDDQAGLQGKWKMVACEHDGKKADLSDQELRMIKLFVMGHHFTLEFPPGDLFGSTVPTRRTMNFAFDASKQPKSIDLTVAEGDDRGKKALGIYSLDGARLRICLCEDGKTRPTEFATKRKSECVLVVYERDRNKEK